MANYYQNQPGYNPSNPQNLQFYSSNYSQQPVSGHSTPFQAYTSGGAQPNAYANAGFGGGFGGQPGVSGRMGEQGGLRTGLLAAFGTEGYDGEPPLLEELGVNFDHIKSKVTAAATRKQAMKLTANASQTLTVLNPTARIDQHLMDDSDLAGPILFALLFGVFLALVSPNHLVRITILSNNYKVWQGELRLHLWTGSFWLSHSPHHLLLDGAAHREQSTKRRRSALIKHAHLLTLQL